MKRMTPQCHSSEQFETTSVVGLAEDFIPPGDRVILTVPPEATERHIWIAAGSYAQPAAADHWFFQGRVLFYLRTKPVGVLEFSDASPEISVPERLLAPRTILRLSASANGSTQPSLRYQETNNAGYVRTNLDIPSFTIRVACDRIVYNLEKCYCATGGFFLTGLRVVSNQ